MADYEQILLGVRCLLHLGAFVIFLSYSDPMARSKPRASALAVALTFISGAFGARAATSLVHFRGMTDNQLVDNILLTILAVILFAMAAACRGNVAKLLPRQSA